MFTNVNSRGFKVCSLLGPQAQKDFEYGVVLCYVTL